MTGSEDLDRLGQPVGDPLAPPPPHWLSVLFHFAALLVGLASAWSFAGQWLANPALPLERTADSFLFLPFLLLGAYGGRRIYREWVRRWQPTLHERGVALRAGNLSGSRVKTFLFDEVRESAIEERQLLVNGDFYGIQRDVELRSETDRVTFRMRALEGRPDYPREFLDRLRAGLAEAAERRLREGGTLAGDGWSLTAAAFRSRFQEVLFDALAGAGLVGESRVGIWRVGEEKPFFTVAAGSTNAMVLHDVLDERLPTHALGLGRFLFEKRSRRVPAFLTGATAAGCFLCAALLLRAGGGMDTMVLAAGGLGAALAVASYLLASFGFRCYERGLVKLSPLGEEELRFSEVARVSYWGTPLYYKVFYIGTTFRMTFHRREGRPLEVSAHSRRATDPDLERLRDRLNVRTAPELPEAAGGQG